MTIDVETPEGRMFSRLAQELHERRTGRLGNRIWTRRERKSRRIRPSLELLYDYWQGDPPLNNVHHDLKPHVREFIRMGRLNVAGLLVSSTQNRMALRGFHTAHRDDETGDMVALELMRATDYRLFARDIHDMMLAMGDGYGLVTPPSGRSKYPTATAEDPRQVITAHDPATGQPRGGLKLIRDDWDAADFAWVFFPGGVVQRLIRKSPRSIIRDGPFRFDEKGWEVDGPVQLTPNGRFPLVRFRNRHGVGEFEQHIDALDRINDKIFAEWWAAKVQAFRQRAVKNLPDADEDGEEIDYTDMFDADPAAMWQVPEGVEFWESQPIDMGPMVTSIQKDLERLAAATSQPLHTITPDAANGSAEGASLMREEHTYKVEDRRDRATPSHAETFALLMSFFGHDHDDHDNRITIEPIWGPLERYSLAEKSSAASQVANVLPLEDIWVDIVQKDPANLPALRQRMARQALFGGVGAPSVGVRPGQQQLAIGAGLRPGVGAAPGRPSDPTTPPAVPPGE